MSTPYSTSPPVAGPADSQPRDGRDARWEAHRVARRRELVEAALRAIRAHGPGVGMDEIAAEASTSKTVIYRHLGDRLGLYLAVCESVDARILGEIDHAVRSSAPLEPAAASSIISVLRAVIDSYLKLVERDASVYRFVVRRPQVQLPEATDPVTGLSSRIADNLTHLLDDLTKPAGEPAGENHQARAFAWGLVGMVKESADRWLEDPSGLSRSELADHLASLAAHGLQGAVSKTNPPPA